VVQSELLPGGCGSAARWVCVREWPDAVVCGGRDTGGVAAPIKCVGCTRPRRCVSCREAASKLCRFVEPLPRGGVKRPRCFEETCPPLGELKVLRVSLKFRDFGGIFRLVVRRAPKGFEALGRLSAKEDFFSLEPNFQKILFGGAQTP